MIKQIHIAGFKSLDDVTVDLAPITVLIGKSGSGKSNFLDAIRFLRDLLLAREANQVVQQFGGWSQVLSMGSGINPRLIFRILFEVEGFPGLFEYYLAFTGCSRAIPQETSRISSFLFIRR